MYYRDPKYEGAVMSSMKNRKSAIPVLLLLLLLVGSFAACSKAPQASPQSSPAQSPQTLFTIDATKVSKIEMRSGNTGIPVTIVDRTVIDDVINKLNGFSYVQKYQENAYGWVLAVEIYDLQNNLAYGIGSSDSVIAYGQFRYQSSEASQAALDYLQSVYDSELEKSELEK